MAKWRLTKFLSSVALVTLVSCAGQTVLQEEPATSSPATTQIAQGTFTPEQNNAICRKMYSGAWNDGKLELLDQYIAPNGLDHSPLSTETGTAGFKKIITTFRNAMPGLKMTIEDEIYNKDRVVHRWKVQGKHTGAPLFGVPASGKEITLTGVSILRMENGKIAERWTNLDQFGLLSQLGVIPPPKSPAPAK